MIYRGISKQQLLLCLILMILTMVLGSFLVDQVAIDRCLDRGGRWSYESDGCEYS
jgi:hypothetical protein